MEESRLRSLKKSVGFRKVASSFSIVKEDNGGNKDQDDDDGAEGASK
jgi:hypothetical protein